MPTYLSGKYAYSARDTSRVDVTSDSLRFSPTDSSVVHTLAYVRYEPGLRIVGRVTSPARRYHIGRDGTVRIDDYEFGYSATGSMIGDRLEVTEPATGHVFEYRVR